MAPVYLIFIVLVCIQNGASLARYTAIFSFGDSLTDTGNFGLVEKNYCCVHPPYGENFIAGPTGRCSNGRLIIDFIAEGLGLPHLPPYLGHSSKDFTQGVNFAVGGATAMNADFFERRGVSIDSDISLGDQFKWFKTVLPSLCASSSDCKDMFSRALFLVGEIGGNDYNYLLQQDQAEETEFIASQVIEVIMSTVTSLIQEGAVTLLVPGNIPIGCMSSHLTVYQSKNKDDYDSTGCLKWLNNLSQSYNSHLQNELNRLRETHVHATIVYVDYYSAALELFRSGSGYSLRSCCGDGGPYNYNLSSPCHFGSTVCDDPSLYVQWDGLHLTQKAYKHIATRILEGTVNFPRISLTLTDHNTM
ncbi:acetylajmaline esterase [Ranunculus cassubicifolius]